MYACMYVCMYVVYVVSVCMHSCIHAQTNCIFVLKTIFSFQFQYSFLDYLFTDYLDMLEETRIEVSTNVIFKYYSIIIVIIIPLKHY